MKKILILISLLIALILNIYGEDQTSSQNNQMKIDEQWVAIKKRSRDGYFTKQELLAFDKQDLGLLENSSIDPKAEPALSELLRDLIIYNVNNVAQDKENSLKAFDILKNKFSDKKHFFDVASEYSFQYAEKNPFVIAKIFECMADLIEGHQDDNLRALDVIYDAVKSPYVIKAKSGTIRYGTNTVLIFLIAYVRKYIELAAQEKINKEAKYMQIIYIIYKDLDLESQTSNFVNIKGARELRDEYKVINNKLKDK